GRAVLYMIPPRCRNCGYVFTDLDSPKKPSKCPMCKSQRIEPPRFYIEAED
ncbi:MAG TPA: transcriptional regulator, partial [Pyrodictium sp.]|nr:transcriptional regulator [Pyrodictium sp.]